MKVSLILFILIVGCASAKPKHDPPEEPILGNYIKPTMTTGASFVFDVRGVVNGEYRKFRLDTGSFSTDILADKKAMAIPSVGKQKYGGAAAQPRECDQIKIQEFEVAGLTRHDVPVIRCEVEPYGNLLGLDVFNEQILSLNFSKDEFSVLQSVPQDMQMTPMRRSKAGHMELPIQIGGVSNYAIFDTGAGFTIIDEKFILAHPETFKRYQLFVQGKMRDVETDFTDITGKPLHGLMYTTSGIQIGSIKLAPQLVVGMAFTDYQKNATDSAIAIVGTNTMVSYDWIFDLKNNTYSAVLRK